MGRTFDTGYLRNIIAYDASGNVGLGGAVDATYKLKVTGAMQVTGAGVFGGAVTANSTSGVSGSFVSNNFFGSIDLENTGGAVAGKWNLQSVSGAQVGATAGSSFGIYSYAASAYRLFITGAGNVGIGTSSPTEVLHLNSSATNAAFIRFQNTGGSGVYVGGRNDNLELYAGGSLKTIITSGGNVGIGTSSPSSFFEAVGNAVDTNIAFFTTIAATNRMLVIARNSTNNAQVDLRAHGSTYSETILGNSMTNAVGVVGSPRSGAAMVVGCTTSSPLVFGTDNTERLRITADGLNTYIGRNATGNFQLSVDGFGNYVFNNSIGGGYRNYLNYALATYMITSNGGNTGMFMSSGGSSWNVFTSDIRVKKNFEPSQGLSELLQIEAVKYHMKTDSDDAPKRLGFKAQNLLPLIPEMVTTNPMALDENGKALYTITPDYLLPVLTKAIQEEDAKVEALKAEVAQLQTRIAYLENK